MDILQRFAAVGQANSIITYISKATFHQEVVRKIFMKLSLNMAQGQKDLKRFRRNK